ncbi:UbiA prenyltransferase family-domain-containing protein [Mycena galopus ATCC 62051]|nr:UbiA prenyltransferase family-domain-containing protein [Mycena galopus ATCC 62051]
MEMISLPKNPEVQLGEHCRRTIGLIFGAIAHEVRVFWDFTWRDWSAGLIPGTMYTIAALRSLDSVSIGLVIQSLVRSLAYFLLYLYPYNIANQISGLDEDRVNKPDRPICSGRVSLEGAYIRWYITTAGYLIVGVAWGVLPWTVLWVFNTICVNFYGGGKHWISKNLVAMSVGAFCQLQAAWGLVTPASARESWWAALLSCVVGAVANVQDMRDIEGDKIAGRRTLPIVLGADFRRVMAAIVCIASLICWVSDFLDGFCGLGLALSMFYLAYRVVSGDSKEYDHKTYMIFTYIYCGCIAVPIIFP